MVTQADQAEAKKRLTMRDKTKDKRAKGQAGISDTANGYWKSDQVSMSTLVDAAVTLLLWCCRSSI